MADVAAPLSRFSAAGGAALAVADDLGNYRSVNGETATFSVVTKTHSAI